MLHWRRWSWPRCLKWIVNRWKIRNKRERERDTRFKWSQKGGEGAEKYFWGRSKLNEEWRKSSGALGPWGGSRQVLTLLPHEICHLHPAPQPRVGQICSKIQSHWSTAYIWTSTYIDLILLPLLFIVSVPLVRLNTQRRVQVSRLGITPLTLTPETSDPYWSVTFLFRSWPRLVMTSFRAPRPRGRGRMRVP